MFLISVWFILAQIISLYRELTQYFERAEGKEEILAKMHMYMYEELRLDRSQ
jgi:predicted DNA-binding protein (UPF0278 family)